MASTIRPRTSWSLCAVADTETADLRGCVPPSDSSRRSCVFPTRRRGRSPDRARRRGPHRRKASPYRSPAAGMGCPLNDTRAVIDTRWPAASTRPGIIGIRGGQVNLCADGCTRQALGGQRRSPAAGLTSEHEQGGLRFSLDFNAGANWILTATSAGADPSALVLVPAGDEFVPAGAARCSPAAPPPNPSSAIRASSICIDLRRRMQILQRLPAAARQSLDRRESRRRSRRTAAPSDCPAPASAPLRRAALPSGVDIAARAQAHGFAQPQRGIRVLAEAMRVIVGGDGIVQAVQCHVGASEHQPALQVIRVDRAYAARAWRPSPERRARAPRALRPARANSNSTTVDTVRRRRR